MIESVLESLDDDNTHGYSFVITTQRCSELSHFRLGTVERLRRQGQFLRNALVL